MQARILSRPANRPLIAATWFLTVLPWLLPYGTAGGLILGALCTLASNGLALILLFSPARADRLNGFSRLVLQFLVLIFGIVFLLHSGVTLDSLYHTMMHAGS